MAAALLAASLLFAIGDARAQSADCAAGDGEGFIGESASFSVSLQNTDEVRGFRPGVDLFLPPGAEFDTARFRGAAMEARNVGTFPDSGSLTHPLTGETISGQPGDTLVFVGFPITAQPQSMPPLVAEVSVTLDNGLTPGTPLSIEASCVYAFGDDALNDPDDDPPVRDDAVAVVTPLIVRVTKGSPPATCTGPSYEFDWSIGIDVAAGATLAPSQITDTLPTEFQVTDVIADNVTIGSLPAGPGGDLIISLPELLGTPGVDQTLLVRGYIVEGTVSQQNPEAVFVTNPVELHGPEGSGSPIGFTTGGGSGETEPAADNSTILADAFLVRETISLLAPSIGFVPDGVVEVALDICVSDDFDFDSVTLTSEIGDGLTFDGIASSEPDAVNGSDPTFLSFELGDLDASSARQLSFEARIDESYLDGTPVRDDERIPTRHVIDGAVRSTGASADSSDEDSGTDRSVPIDATAFFKTTLSPIDGDAAPGELVRYRLFGRLPTGDLGATRITDFLPAPVLPVADCVSSVGPENTAGVPSSQSDSVNNALIFDFGTISNTNGESVIDLEIECVMSSAPAEDGFVFTNVARLQGENNRDGVDLRSFTPLTQLAPEMRITIDADVSDADAGDTINYEIVVTNEGHADSFGVLVENPLPVDTSLLAAPTVQDSAGQPVAFSGDLFDGGVTLSDPVSGVDQGDNLVFIRYSVVIDDGVAANAQIASVAAIRYFASVAEVDAPNHAVPAADYEDVATVRVTRFIPTIALNDPTRTRYTIGEHFLYDVTVTVSEGLHPNLTVRANLDNGLVFLEAQNFANPDALVCDDSSCVLPEASVSNNGRTAVWNFGDMNNPPDDDLEAFSFQMRVGVANLGAASRGVTRRSRIQVTGRGANSAPITIAEPTLAGVAAFAPEVADGGDLVVLHTSLEHTPASDSDAHDVLVSYDVSDTGVVLVPDSYADPEGSCPAPQSVEISASGAQIRYHSLALAVTCSFSIDAVVATNVTAGAALIAPGVVTWESVAGEADFGLEERTASDGYIDSMNAELAVPPAAVEIEFISSSRPETDDPALALGEEATYRIEVTLPDGEHGALRVIDDPPAGMAITEVRFDTDGFDGTLTAPGAPTSGAPDQPLVWDFGPVVANSAPGSDGNTFVIEVVGRTTFADGIRDEAQEKLVSATIGGTPQVAQPFAVTYVLPAPRLALATDNSTPSAGDTVTAELLITNLGDAIAYDGVINSAVPAGFVLVPLDIDGIDNDADGATDEGDESALAVGNLLTFPVDGALAPAAARQYGFKFVAESGIDTAPVSLTATLGRYASLPGDAGVLLDPVDDEADNNGAGGVDESGDPSVNAQLDPAAPELLYELSVTDENGALLEPGEFLTYTLRLRNFGDGAAEGVLISHVIPNENALFVPDSQAIAPDDLTLNLNDGAFTSDVGVIVPGGEVVITYRMQVEQPLAQGSAITGQATATLDNGYGPLVSDDPSTEADDDPTVIATASTNDRDGDGVPNDEDSSPDDPSQCADADGDACDDCLNGPTDPANDGQDGDGDGFCDIGDIDADNDGISDVEENAIGLDPYADADGDSVPNYLDADDRGDGEPSATCEDIDGDLRCDSPGRLYDSDGDTVPDHLDLDADNDGIPDVVEAGHTAGDLDVDGFADGPYGARGIAVVLDQDNDGVIDYAVRDTDGDGTPDFQDVDSDDDGAGDLAETGGEAFDGDGDGRIDDIVDNDGDGIGDVVDDDDAAGFPNLDEPTMIADYDGDGDGIPDPYDRADGVGTPDGGDSNDDGFDDAIQCPLPPGWPACPDADEDGTPDYGTPSDLDGDGVFDAIDLDSDDDGIPNLDEALLGLDPYNDNDGDGVANYRDADDRGDGNPQACVDDALDLICDASGSDFDRDGDGVANHLDLDADNDGIPDATEAGHGGDGDGDALIDCPAGVGQNGLCDDVESSPDSGLRNYPLLNTDGVSDTGDDIPDFLDIDSDGDGANDIDEVSGLAALDGDGDGQIDELRDLDGDGLMAPIDDDERFGYPMPITDPAADDSDGDGIPDAYDLALGADAPNDSDGDGLSDADECAGAWPCRDSDGDGVPDYMEESDADRDGIADIFDLDDDGDGIPDTLELRFGDEPLDIDPSADADRDGTPNFLDRDDRGDGVAQACADADENGECDVLTPEFDFDGDGVANHFDLDADGDGIYDANESGFGYADADRDGVLDCMSALGENGLCDAVEIAPDSGETPDARDSDGDRIPDFLDLDSDGDTISDRVEAGDSDPATLPIDSDSDGEPDYVDTDSDNDTIPDWIEAGDADLVSPPRNTDGYGEPDYRDSDSDNDGVGDSDEVGSDPNRPVDSDGDGLPDYIDEDSDGDGVADGVDNCRLASNADQLDTDGDGGGQACDLDDNGDGYDDELGVEGGGCQSGASGDLSTLLVVLLALGLLWRRRVRSLAGAASLACALTLSLPVEPVSAQVATVDTEYTVERFRLAADRGGVLDVESGDVPAHLSFDLGLWVGYADDPLTVYRPMEDGRERVASLVSHRIGSNLVGSLSLFNRLQLALDVPFILDQDQSVGGLMGAPASIASAGLGDLRVTPKLQLLGRERFGIDLAVSLGVTLPTGTSEDYFGDESVMWQPELALSRPLTARLRAAINLGYRARKQQNALNLTVGNEVYGHLGVGYMATSSLEFDATLSAGTEDTIFWGRSNRNFSELRAGAAYHLDRAVVFAAAGLGLSNGFGSPDWRILAGVRFGRVRAAEPARRLPVAEPVVAVVDERPEVEVEETAIPLDSDGDGIFDDVDGCRVQAEDIDGFEDGDGCLDVDNDSDTVLDEIDECPNEFGVAENAGCPDPDRDADTVVDRLDNCPDEPGVVEHAGCNAKQSVKLVDGGIELLDRVYFKTSRARIRHRSHAMLREVARVLNEHPEIQRIRVEGHTDSRGDDESNIRLSQRRAESVVAFLIKSGVAAERLEAVGFGELRPIASNDTNEGRSTNRRVELVIVGDRGNIRDQNSGPTEDTFD